MAYTSGTASNYLDLMDRLRRYAAGIGTAGTPTPGSNTGNGTVTGVDCTAATVTETWTLTCTAAATNGGTFSVVGSVTGALANATVGVAYSNAKISFTINDGTADFIIGDSFTIATTAGALAGSGSVWEVQRWAGGNELILKGQGLSGGQQIYVGFTVYYNVSSDYYNWECRGFTGFNSGMTFATQPGVSAAKYLSLWNSSIPYWFVVNGQRIIVVAKVSTTYHLGYFGYWYPYGTPTQFPYPVIIAASAGQQGQRWSSTATTHTNITGSEFNSNDDNVYNSAIFYGLDGAWKPMARINSGTTPTANYLWPWNYRLTGNQLSTLDVNPDGSYTMLPAILCQANPNNLLGELDGMMYVTGQALAAEDLVSYGGSNYLVVPNIYRATRSDYCAIKLA